MWSTKNAGILRHCLYRQKRKCLNEICKAAWSLVQGTRLEFRKTWVVITALLLLLALVCFRFPASHLVVTQSNVPSLPAPTEPEKFGGVPPHAVPDSFLSSPDPAHGVTVTCSWALTQRLLLSFLLPSTVCGAWGKLIADTSTSSTGCLVSSFSWVFADAPLLQTCLVHSPLRGKNQHSQEKTFPGAEMEIILDLATIAVELSVPSAAKWKSYQEKVLPIHLCHMLFH